MHNKNYFRSNCQRKRSIILLVIVLLITITTLSSGQQSTPNITAGQVFDLIKSHTGGSSNWSGNTVDTFKAGDSTTVVTGIVTTFTPTMEVLKKAVAANCNLIISHEPTFYNHTDETSWLSNNPVFKTKLDFINQHHLVICRFHDHIHFTPGEPDKIMLGMVDELKWKSHQSAADEALFNLPGTTLKNLADYLKKQLNIRALRVIGNPKLKVSKVAFLPGAYGGINHIKAFEKEGVNVLVIGEANEWEGIAYAVDASQQNRNQAMILLGHFPSEENGMKYCAEWLKGFLPAVPIKFISCGEPFWLPE
jgi:putative NIF3 family GTP cyclohydrolase 1 type 2